MKYLLLCLLFACSGSGPYPSPMDSGPDTFRRPAGPSHPAEYDASSTGRPRGGRDAGLSLVDAGETPCRCAVEPYEDPPYICFIQFCWGDRCINPGYQGKPKCFYTGYDPAP